MKKIIRTLSILGGICALAFTSCEKIKDSLFPAFDAEIADVSVAVPITVAGTENSTSSTVSFNLDSTIKANTQSAFGTDNLSSVKVKDLRVFLLETTELNNISNFENVKLALSSNTNTTPAIIADAMIPNVQAADINIPVANSPELKEYLTGNQLTYTLTGKARRTTTKPLNATVSVTLSIK